MKKVLTTGTVFLMAILVLAALACGPSAPVETPAQTPAAQEPVAKPATPVKIPATQEPAAQPATPVNDPATQEPVLQPDMVDKQAPIDGVELVISDANPPQYTLKITSGLPSGCARFGGYELSRDGNSITVTVTNQEPAGPVACTAIYGQHQGQVDLGSDFTQGETYTVVVNGQKATSFTAGDPQDDKMAKVLSPIERTEVEVSQTEPPEYTLTVVSTLPLGSSCSRFDGYDVVRPVANVIQVMVSHLEVTGLQECTADLPIITTEISLGTEFTPGETYRVMTNGEITNAFTARGPQDQDWVVKESPIRGSEIIILESFPPQYRINVISALPRGSSCSRFNGYDIVRPSANLIELTVTHLEVPQDNVPCTRDLPVVETGVSLGSDFVSGEEYKVTINGQVTELFIAQ